LSEYHPALPRPVTLRCDEDRVKRDDVSGVKYPPKAIASQYLVMLLLPIMVAKRRTTVL